MLYLICLFTCLSKDQVSQTRLGTQRLKQPLMGKPMHGITRIQGRSPRLSESMAPSPTLAANRFDEAPATPVMWERRVGILFELLEHLRGSNGCVIKDMLGIAGIKWQWKSIPSRYFPPLFWRCVMSSATRAQAIHSANQKQNTNFWLHMNNDQMIVEQFGLQYQVSSAGTSKPRSANVLGIVERSHNSSSKIKVKMTWCQLTSSSWPNPDWENAFAMATAASV